jgi:hypothetical protein
MPVLDRKIRVAFVLGDYPPEERKRREDTALAYSCAEVLNNFVDKTKELIKLGADVILPMGITQCPVHIKPDWLMKELGVPVVEGTERQSGWRPCW